MAFAASPPLLLHPHPRGHPARRLSAPGRRHPLVAATVAGPTVAAATAVAAAVAMAAAAAAAPPPPRPSQSRAASTLLPSRTALSQAVSSLLSSRAALSRALAVLVSPRAARSVATALLGVAAAAAATAAGWFHPWVAVAGGRGSAPLPPRVPPPPVTRRGLGRRLASTAATFAAGAAVGVTAVTLPRATVRYRDAADIPSAAFPAAAAPGGRGATRGVVLSAFVTDVADGDTLRVRHTPLRPPGSAANDPATYFARRALPRSDPDALPRGAEETLPVRLAGVDCPEVGHFGKPGQPLGEDAKVFVANLLVTHGGGDPGPDGSSSSGSNKSKKDPPRGAGAAVRLGLLSRDQYGRLVATLWVGPPWAAVNVSAALLAAGLAVVYRGAGAVNGGWGAEYERLEADAKARGVGVWGAAGGGESPSEFKARMRAGG